MAATSFLLVLWDATLLSAQETHGGEPASETVQEATGTIRDLGLAFYAFLPKLAIVLIILTLGWLLSRFMRWLHRQVSPYRQRATSAFALAQIILSFVVLVASLSVLVGDIRALIGSLGLVGLALSWALQTPIESFTGWLLNTFRSYYRVGDRIEVGEVFGDVYRIDVLTTTVWEIGGPGKPVAGAQPTGAVITFPNSEILRSNLINYSRDFPYVWDEITTSVANESDLSYTIQTLKSVASHIIGQEMFHSAQRYEELLRAVGLQNQVAKEPQVYLSYGETWINCTIRYLVGIGSRRRWSSALIEALSQELARKEHKDKIITAYPRNETILRWHQNKGQAESKHDVT